jgi:hypothetical protein
VVEGEERAVPRNRSGLHGTVHVFRGGATGRSFDDAEDPPGGTRVRHGRRCKQRTERVLLFRACPKGLPEEVGCDLLKERQLAVGDTDVLERCREPVGVAPPQVPNVAVEPRVG